MFRQRGKSVAPVTSSAAIPITSMPCAALNAKSRRGRRRPSRRRCGACPDRTAAAAAAGSVPDCVRFARRRLDMPRRFRRTAAASLDCTGLMTGAFVVSWFSRVLSSERELRKRFGMLGRLGTESRPRRRSSFGCVDSTSVSSASSGAGVSNFSFESLSDRSCTEIVRMSDSGCTPVSGTSRASGATPSSIPSSSSSSSSLSLSASSAGALRSEKGSSFSRSESESKPSSTKSSSCRAMPTGSLAGTLWSVSAFSMRLAVHKIRYSSSR